MSKGGLDDFQITADLYYELLGSKSAVEMMANIYPETGEMTGDEWWHYEPSPEVEKRVKKAREAGKYELSDNL